MLEPMTTFNQNQELLNRVCDGNTMAYLEDEDDEDSVLDKDSSVADDL